MSKTNCPNCGAPIEKDKEKCAYCGTWYIDLTMIDFDNQEPFFLTIKQNGYLLTQKVIPQTASFESTEDTVYATGGKNNSKLISFTTNRRLETNIQFIAVPFDTKNHKQILCTAKQEKTNE